MLNDLLIGSPDRSGSGNWGADKMRRIVAAALLATAGLSQSAWAQNNVGPPANPLFTLDGQAITHSFTSYSFNFTAGSALTNLTFAFRDDPAFLTLDNVRLFTGNGPNLLVNGDFEAGPAGAQAPTGWSYLNQYGATAGGVVQSGRGVNGSFGYYDGAVQAYDAITQSVATTIGSLYTVSFMLNENSSLTTYRAVSNNGQSGSGGNGVNLAVYAQAGVPVLSAVPEPATWSMLILGFGAVGFAMRRRTVATRVAFAG